MQELKDYASDEDIQRLNKDGEVLLGGRFIATLKIIFIFLPQFICTWLFRIRKMNRKWPHSAVTPEMLGSKISDLRIEYGIEINEQYQK